MSVSEEQRIPLVNIKLFVQGEAVLDFFIIGSRIVLLMIRGSNLW